MIFDSFASLPNPHLRQLLLQEIETLLKYSTVKF